MHFAAGKLRQVQLPARHRRRDALQPVKQGRKRQAGHMGVAQQGVDRIKRLGLGAVLAGPPPAGATEVTTLATEAIEVHLDRRLRAVRSVAGI